MKKTLLFYIVAICAISLNAQDSENRIEFETKDGYSEQEIFPYGKNGFVMSSFNENSPKGKKEWRFELYDVNLQSKLSSELEIPKQFSVSKTYKNKENIYNLYTDKKRNFIIANINVSNLQIEQTEGKFSKKIEINDNMVVLGNYAYLSVKIKKKPNIVVIDLKEGTHTIIPILLKGISPKKIFVNDLQVLEKDNEVFLYVRGYISKKMYQLFAIKINENSELENPIRINDNDKQTIQAASATKLSDNKYIFVGTYSTGIGFAQGYYISEIANGESNYIKYYNFLDLKNFLSYLPEKRVEKIQKKKKKKEKKGKTLDLGFQLTTHDIITLDDSYIFLGEFYYATYRTETYTTTSTNANGGTVTTTHTRQVFTGYQYTHAAVVKFSKEGELIWDNTFSMYPYSRPYYVKKFVNVSNQSSEEIGLAFADNNRISSLSINLNSGEITKERRTEEMEKSLKGDKEKYSYTDMDYWYDNYFISYGEQKIKNTEDKNTKRKRKVFFVSKYQYN